MGRARYIFNITLFGALLLSVSARASDMPQSLSPFTFKAIYTFQYGAIHFGKIGVESEQTDDHYAITTDVASGGILKLLTKHSSHTNVDGTGAHFRYDYAVYDSRYRTKEKRRSVYLEYKKGRIITEKIVPPENRNKRPAVHDELRYPAFDLLTFNMELRRLFWKALKEKQSQFSLNTYDGRRLYKIDATVIGRKTTAFRNERKFPVYTVKLRRTAVAGFTASELAKIDDNEPAALLHYSADQKFIPIKAEVPFLFGTLSATLAKECLAEESCLLGIKE